MSTNTHPGIFSRLFDRLSGRRYRSETDEALRRATGETPRAGDGERESGEDKLARAAERNDTSR